MADKHKYRKGTVGYGEGCKTDSEESGVDAGERWPSSSGSVFPFPNPLSLPYLTLAVLGESTVRSYCQTHKKEEKVVTLQRNNWW